MVIEDLPTSLRLWTLKYLLRVVVSIGEASEDERCSVQSRKLRLVYRSEREARSAAEVSVRRGHVRRSKYQRRTICDCED